MTSIALLSSLKCFMDDSRFILLPVPLLLSLSLIFLISLYLFSKSKSNSTRTNSDILPPSPPFQLPLIGHLHLIKPPIARSLHALSLHLGPVYSLRFGSRLVVVVSSSSAAEDCLSRNDAVLANRPRFLIGDHVGYNWSNLVNAPYGDSWRFLRKICAVEIFSTARLAQFSASRKRAVEKLIRRIANIGSAEVVVFRPLLKEMMLDVLMMMIFGEDLGATKSEFVETVTKVLEAADTANPTDFVPIWRCINWGGYEKRIKKLGEKMDRLLQGLVDEKRRKRRGGVLLVTAEHNMIDRLLDLQNSDPESYTDVMIKGLMLVLFVAGNDTSPVTIEWAMSLLLNHPDILRKARDEIDSLVGQHRPVTELDLQNLPFLQSIISETMRLYPATPVLIPHYSSQDCTVSGYKVPLETIVFINAWAIHRDPSDWEDPLSFKPERFEGRAVESFKFLPFGIGRRACPGYGLAHRVVGLALASMIQCFEWKRVREEQVDMREGIGLTMPKATPLEALCKARPIASDLCL